MPCISIIYLHCNLIHAYTSEISLTIQIIIVWQNLGEIYEDLELDFKLFSLLILVVHTMSLKNPSDATLALLSHLIYPRWRPRWRPIISETIV